MSLNVPKTIKLVTTEGFDDYQLLDSGEGRKLERFGAVIVDRPEAQALWSRRQNRSFWMNAHAVYCSNRRGNRQECWEVHKDVPDRWPICVGDVTMMCRLKGLWHLGIFPDQWPHWQWLRDVLKSINAVHPVRVLNLFAYTGAATLLSAYSGAHVTHVDSSKQSIAWGKENQKISGLENYPIRWILDDVMKFVRKEVRRGKTYELILIDPPKFGRGPGNEIWNIFDHIPELLVCCRSLLSPHAKVGLLLTCYAIRSSTISLAQLVEETVRDRNGTLDVGELAVVESGGGRMIPTSLYSRWLSEKLASHSL